MLFIVGLGLGDEKDITLRGLEAVKKCEKVYIEAYTSLLSFGLSSDGLSTLVCILTSFLSQYLFFFLFQIILGIYFLIGAGKIVWEINYACG